ncbi:hypothetical protein C5167_009737 [Papaver somniferum]|uniref:Uncharacterized protein n=1 Tax=Papaver somniferum TaxID=3469 RepID=A0A4Y7K263_PAPSO|nr:hypothetical protein C5167_009737 [Papaver somniferum]
MAWAYKHDPEHTGGLIKLILITKDGVEHLYQEDAKVFKESYKEWMAAQKKEEREAKLARKHNSGE